MKKIMTILLKGYAKMVLSVIAFSSFFTGLEQLSKLNEYMGIESVSLFFNSIILMILSIIFAFIIGTNWGETE